MRKSRRIGWFEKLRDGLAKGTDIGWYVVYCGDEDRSPVHSEERTAVQEEEIVEHNARPKTPRSANFRNMFGRRDRRPSRETKSRGESSVS